VTDAPAAAPSLIRRAAGITGWNLASRLTGFVRVLVVAGALGATFLGNTYQSANLVSNVLFELLAAGMLAAVLVPALVARLTSGTREDARALAGGVLGRALVALAAIVVVGAAGAPWVMRALTAGVVDESVRAAQIRLGSFLLLFFLPQVVLYAVGAVTSAILQADSRFAAAAAAPVANNLVVIMTLGWFWSRGAAGLELALLDRLILAAGTTGGVLAMTLVPALAARRAGLGVRPHLRALPELGGLLRSGAWAGATLAATQVFVFATIVFANRVEGGVVAYQVAFTLFLLPHALFAHPIATALFPQLAAAFHVRNMSAFRRDAGHGLGLLLFALLPISAVVVAVAPPAVRALSVGGLERGAAPELVAAALAGYAFGLVGYSAILLLTRVAYAAGDARTPAIVNGVAVVLGVVLMAVLSNAAAGPDRTRALGVAHTGTVLAAAAVLALVLVRRHLLEVDVPSFVRALAWSAGSGVVARVVVDALTGRPTNRAADVAATVAAVAVAGLVYVGGQALTGASELRRRAVSGGGA